MSTALPPPLPHHSLLLSYPYSYPSPTRQPFPLPVLGVDGKPMGKLMPDDMVMAPANPNPNPNPSPNPNPNPNPSPNPNPREGGTAAAFATPREAHAEAGGPL